MPITTQDINVISGFVKQITDKLNEVIQSIPEKEPNESLMEIFEKDTSLEAFTANYWKLPAPVDKFGNRTSWEWMYVENIGNNSAKIGINGDGNSGFTLPSGKNRLIEYSRLKINEVSYGEVTSGSHTTIYFILLRPKTDREIGKI